MAGAGARPPCPCPCWGPTSNWSLRPHTPVDGKAVCDEDLCTTMMVHRAWGHNDDGAPRTDRAWVTLPRNTRAAASSHEGQGTVSQQPAVGWTWCPHGGGRGNTSGGGFAGVRETCTTCDGPCMSCTIWDIMGLHGAHGSAAHVRMCVGSSWVHACVHAHLWLCAVCMAEPRIRASRIPCRQGHTHAFPHAPT